MNKPTMGKKEKKRKKCKSKKKHPLLVKPDTFSIGQRITLQELYDQYYSKHEQLEDNKRSTVNSNRRYLRRWGSWWGNESDERLTITMIDIRHLEEFRQHLLSEGKKPADVNAHVDTVAKLLRFARDRQLIEHAPRIKALRSKNSEPKIIIPNEHIDKLWYSADSLPWPRKDVWGNRLPYPPATVWRSLLVMWWTYGFRTQELVRFEDRFRPLRWSDIHPPGQTPNEEGHTVCEWGWYKFTPQKQEKVKPDPVTNPLTMYAAAALESIRPYGPVHPNHPVYAIPKSSSTFYQIWRLWMDRADVHPRQTPGKKRRYYKVKYLRKTATTNCNNFLQGIGPHVVGHDDDRSGQKNVVSENHYYQAEEAVLKCLMNMPVPSCFENLLSQRIRR